MFDIETISAGWINLCIDTVVTSIFFSLIIYFVLYLFFYRDSKSTRINIPFLLFIITLFFLKLALPVEFGFSATVPETIVLPSILEIMNSQAFNFGYLSVSVGELILFIWVVGSVFSALFLGVSLFKLHRLKRVLMQSKEIFTISCLKKNVFAIRVGENTQPCILGLYKPIIILPKGLSIAEESWIIKHETTHYKKMDVYIKLIFEILRIIYWWNPIVIVVQNYLIDLLELRVDQVITQSKDLDKRLEYAQLLLKMEKKLIYSGKTFGISYFVSNNEKFLQNRVHQVVHNRPKQAGILKKVIAISLLATFMFSLKAYSIPDSISETTVRITPANSYIQKEKDSYFLFVDGDLFSEVSEEVINSNFEELEIVE